MNYTKMVMAIFQLRNPNDNLLTCTSDHGTGSMLSLSVLISIYLILFRKHKSVTVTNFEFLSWMLDQSREDLKCSAPPYGFTLGMYTEAVKDFQDRMEM